MDNQEHIDFIGIGLDKCGTTWLRSMLDAHPDVLLSPIKEINYFNGTPGPGNFFVHSKNGSYYRRNYSNVDKGIDWYLSKFPLPEQGKVRGEFSGVYLFEPEACYLIRKSFPDAKLLVALRNPVDFLYSLYWWLKSSVWARVPDSFEACLEETNIKIYGHFAKYLQPYYNTFPASHIHIALLEDIRERPQDVLKDLFHFLGVDEHFVPKGVKDKVNPAIKIRYPILREAIYNSILLAQSLRLQWLVRHLQKRLYPFYRYLNYARAPYEPMNERTRKSLNDYFEPEINDLRVLTRLNFSHWVPGPLYG